jgi:endonuclease/exonuclease/phosphatase (EEP) superfamily protein YafD
MGAVGWLATTGCGLKAGYVPDRIPLTTGEHGEPRPEAVTTLRVVSWNLRFAEKTREAAAEIHADSILAGADLLLLQEMNRAGTEYLAKELGRHHVYAAAYVHPHHAELFGNAILSRWPIVATEALALPHGTPLTGHRRIALAATIQLADRTLRVVTTHTATMIVDQSKRLAQARAVLDSLGQTAGPQIIGGDFNTVSAYEVTLLRRMARKLGFAAVRLPPGPTARGSWLKLPGEALVLDHLFYKDLTVEASGVVHTARASDHWPIWADFRLHDASKPAQAGPTRGSRPSGSRSSAAARDTS